MTTKAKKKPKPILATHDRQTLLCASMQLLNRSFSDSNRTPSIFFIKRYLEDIQPYELADVMTTLGREYGYQALNAFGKLATSNLALESKIKAFKWIALRPDKLALLQTIYDILLEYDHAWPLADFILLSGHDFKPYRLTKKQKEVHKIILTSLLQGPTMLNVLNELVGKDCRPYILELRSLSYNIHMRPYWNSETGVTHTQFYLTG